MITSLFSGTRAKKSIAIFILTLFLAAALLPQTVFADDDMNKTTTATVTFTGGFLKIMNVPSFDFGSIAITEDVIVANAENISSQIKVADTRGTGGNWSLTVQLGVFKTNVGSITTLNGSSITIDSQGIDAADGTVGTPPVLITPITIASGGGEVTLLDAPGNTGMGVWKIDLANANVSLSVLPGTARPEACTADLIWTLQATP